MNRLFYLIVLMLFNPLHALAIVNVESMDLKADAEGVSGKAGVAMQSSSGNTVKQSYDLEGLLMYKQDAHLSFFSGSYSYGKAGVVRNTSKSFLHARHRYQLDDAWAVEAFTQYQRNEFSRLSSRVLWGGGGRFGIHPGVNAWVNVGLGGFYEREQLQPKAATTDVLHASLWRMNGYLSWKQKLAENVSLYQVVYYQPAMKDFGDFRMLGQLSLTVSLSDALGLRLSVDAAHDSRPPQQVKSSDVTQKVILDYAF
ncbi:MAG: DUF481 domain-containing protein [Zetaproteobacteria bacterium]|nr:DUF481 domain-containing protein [Zetaproteobacteria bacterium]